jgi:hypothetical protein
MRRGKNIQKSANRRDFLSRILRILWEKQSGEIKAAGIFRRPTFFRPPINQRQIHGGQIGASAGDRVANAHRRMIYPHLALFAFCEFPRTARFLMRSVKFQQSRLLRSGRKNRNFAFYDPPDKFGSRGVHAVMHRPKAQNGGVFKQKAPAFTRCRGQEGSSQKPSVNWHPRAADRDSAPARRIGQHCTSRTKFGNGAAIFFGSGKSVAPIFSEAQQNQAQMDKRCGPAGVATQFSLPVGFKGDFRDGQHETRLERLARRLVCARRVRAGAAPYSASR